MSKSKKIIKQIIKTLNDNAYLKSIFYRKTKNRKYILLNIYYLACKAIHVGLHLEACNIYFKKWKFIYRMIYEYPNITTSNAPHWSTIYDFFRVNPTWLAKQAE